MDKAEGLYRSKYKLAQSVEVAAVRSRRRKEAERALGDFFENALPTGAVSRPAITAQMNRLLTSAATILAGLLGFVDACGIAHAQETQFKQLQQAKPPTQITTQDEKIRSFGTVPEDDEEIGKQFILQRRVGVPQFAVAGDAQYYFTSNGLLTDRGAKSDAVFIGTAGASWNPTWIKDVTGSVFARQQYFRYDRLNDIDFDATTFGFNAGGPVMDWFNLGGGYSVSRLESRETDDEFYKEGDFSLAISRSQMFGQRIQIPYGYTFDFFHSTPGEFTRLTHGLFAGVNWLFHPRFLAQFFYRFQLEDYQSASRFDQAHILSGSLTYSITSWASARVFVSWTTNDSDIPRDYDVFSGGGGVNLLLRF